MYLQTQIQLNIIDLTTKMKILFTYVCTELDFIHKYT